MAYPCPNFIKTSITRRLNTPYPEAFIRCIERRLMNILEYYNRGAYAKYPNTPYPTLANTMYRPFLKLYKYKTLNSVLVGIIKEPTYIEINFLLDVQIQQEIPSVLSVPLLDVLVSVIPPQTSTTSIPTPIPTPLPTPLIITWTKVDHYEAIAEVVQTNVINEVKNQLPKFLPKAVSDLVTPSIESKVRDVLQEYTIDPVQHDSQKDKEILYKMMRESKSYEKNPTHKALYDPLMLSLILDEYDMDKGVVEPHPQKKRQNDDKDQDTFAGSDQGMKKRKKSKDAEQSKRTDQSGSSKGKAVEDGPKQNWLSDLANAKKPPLTFDDLISTPIDFMAFAMNRLKLTKLTKVDLVGPVYNLLKGTCKSFVELEYNIKECNRALSDKLDWNNPEGNQCPYDLSKPLPLHGSPGRLFVHADFFFNNDLEYLRAGNTKRKYTTSITKTKAARYDLKGIGDMVHKL
ncbi:hypothetical protein Tco_1541505 [Tanacetum coccineum]